MKSLAFETDFLSSDENLYFKNPSQPFLEKKRLIP